MSFDPTDFIEINPSPKKFIQTANGALMTVNGCRKIQIGEIKLPNCLFIPELNYKLLLINHLTKCLPYSVLITSGVCHVHENQTGKTIWNGTNRDGLYFLQLGSPQGNATLARESLEHQLWVWHRRLGHPSFSYLKFLFPSLTKNISSFNCESCVLAKSHKHSYLSSTSHNREPFALIHTDVWGPSPNSTPFLAMHSL